MIFSKFDFQNLYYSQATTILVAFMILL